MDEFTKTARAGARELAEQVIPAAAKTVRARGEHLRHRRAARSIVLVTAGVAVVGIAAFAAFGEADNHVDRKIVPGINEVPSPTRQPTPTPELTAPETTGPSAPTLSPPAIAAPPSTTSAQTSHPSPTSTPTGSPSTSSSSSTSIACTSRDIAISESPLVGRTGHMIRLFLFHNTGGTTCSVSGFPRVSGVDEHGRTTTTAADILSGWASPNVSSVPTVDIPAGGYASAGVEWLNRTADGSSCALVSTIEVTLPSGGTPTPFSGVQSSTDGTACSGFSIHPILPGFDPDYWYPPYQPPTTNGN